ncbi:hypothetical protein ABPG72_021883 [Tetrahymena utriculariae]
MRSTVLLVAILSLLSLATFYSFKTLERNETQYFGVQLCFKALDPDIGQDVGILALNTCQQNMTFTFILGTEQTITTNCLSYLETEVISQIPSTGATGFEWRQSEC